MATKQKSSPPGTIWKQTHAVTTRQFWLRPDPGLTQGFLYVLAVWSTRYGIAVHLATVLSNHLHTLLTDVLGDRIQPFNRDFYSALSKVVNRFRGRKGNLLDPEGVNDVMVCPLADDLVSQGVYVSMNAVEAELVERAKKWPGVNFVPSDMGTVKLEIERPSWFFDPFGAYPETVTLELTIPNAVDCTKEELRERMQSEHKRQEDAKRQSMANARRRFMGRKRILRQSLHSRPRKDPAAFELRPQVACLNKPLRIRILQWLKERQLEYRRALFRARGGEAGVVFPSGTWYQHFFSGHRRASFEGSIWVALMSEP